jgi:uncharacterized membrane protein YfcA
MLAAIREEWRLPTYTWILWVAVMVGALGGSFLGSRVLPQATIRQILAIVVFIAGGKLLASIVPW